MTKNHFKQSISLLIYIFSAVVIISCASQKNIPASSLTKTPSWKNLYYFQCEDSIWIIKPVPAAGNQFSGVIFKPEVVKKNRQVRIYAYPLTSVKIENNVLSCPMENIIKVENFKISPGVIFLSAGIVILLFLIPTFL
jgi:hypothetical protein